MKAFSSTLFEAVRSLTDKIRKILIHFGYPRHHVKKSSTKAALQNSTGVARYIINNYF